MEMPKSLWPPKGRAAIAAWSGVGALAVLGVVSALAWPALVRPEPPLEADAGRDGVRISLVQPPKTAPPTASRLDVGVPEAALAMVDGQRAPVFAARPAPEPRPEPPEPIGDSPAPLMPDSTTPLLVEDDTPPPVREDEVEPGWARNREADDRYEAARLAQERAERRALRRAQQQRELDRWDDYQPPPPDDRPPPERW